jgi:hypothetical protein
MSTGNWTARPGSRVTCKPMKKDGNATPPPGMWRILDRAPDPQSWWLMALDEQSKEHAKRHGKSGCISRSSHGLDPVDRVRL